MGLTSFGRLILLIFIESPISDSIKSNSKISGILFALHFNSILLLTIFNTPPCLIPGHFSLLRKLTGTSTVTFVLS